MRRINRVAIIPLLLILLFPLSSSSGTVLAATGKNCSDFKTQSEAQAYFDKQGGSKSNDADSLDADHDGIPCESLKHTGTIAKTVDAATGGGIGTGIAIGVVLCLAALAGAIFWLYKRKPSTDMGLSSGIGTYSSSPRRMGSDPVLASIAADASADDGLSPAPALDSASQVSAAPAVPVSVGAPASEPVSAPLSQPLTAPSDTTVAGTGTLVLSLSTPDASSVPASSQLEIGGKTLSLASSTGSMTSEVTVPLSAGEHSYTITGVAPFAEIKDRLRVQANAPTQVELTLTTPEAQNPDSAPR